MADQSEYEVRNLSELEDSCNSFLNDLQQSTNGSKHYIEFVDSVEKAKLACDQLRSFKELAFDCEGVRLGKGGKLTLIQLMAKDDKIFIFDVLALGESLFQNTGLREILESKEIWKVMFDCRDDSDSLWEEYKVKLSNVLDMQLLEYIVRPGLREPYVQSLGNTVKLGNTVNLFNAIGISDFASLKKNVGKIIGRCPTVWKCRPLHEGLERYAALHVVISVSYTHLTLPTILLV